MVENVVFKHLLPFLTADNRTFTISKKMLNLRAFQLFTAQENLKKGTKRGRFWLYIAQ